MPCQLTDQISDFIRRTTTTGSLIVFEALAGVITFSVRPVKSQTAEIFKL